jgi:hypothetical protein
MLEGTVSKGFALLKEVRHINDQDELIGKMQTSISPAYTASFDDMFRWTTQQLRRWSRPSEKDKFEEEAINLPPAGDVGNQPPLIWHLSK